MDENQISVLLVEDNPLDWEPMKLCIEKQKDMELVGVTGSAIQAREMTVERHPDAIILDLELEAGDGMDFVDWLHDAKLPVMPFVIVTTNNSSKIIWDRVRDRGADFVYHKKMINYSAQYVVNSISHTRKYIKYRQGKTVEESSVSFLSASEKEADLCKRAEAYLETRGFKSGWLGYKSIVGTMLIYSRPGGKDAQLHKNIYPELSERFNTSPDNIEKNIRYAIEAAFKEIGPELAEQYYRPATSRKRGIPSNKEYVLYVARELGVLRTI